MYFVFIFYDVLRHYLCHHLAGEGIVALDVTLPHCVHACVCVRRAAYITYRLHAALASAVKVMRCIQCSLVVIFILY